MKTVQFRQVIAVAFLLVGHTAFSQEKLPQLGHAPVSEIIKLMTLEEKASVVAGTGMRFQGHGAVIGEADGRVPGAAGNTMSINRFGIPGTVLSDGPAGVRIDPFRKGDSTKSYYATAWPVGTLLASSWDTALVKKVGVGFGNEIKEYGVDVILAPGMNIQRNPLNGRNFEYFSEDPYVSGYMAAAMVNGIQSNGVGTSIKHFAANNQESNRNAVNAIISERALRELYLRSFEIAVKRSQPMTVMSSYNKINGTYTSESYDLLTKILREEWGFKGMVMTDWFGGKDPVAQMKAGNDLLEPGTPRQQQAIIDAVKNGTLEVKVLDQNVERVLLYILKTPSFRKYQYANTPNLKSHATLSRSAAADGMVLLKNDNSALPLNKSQKVALFGIGSYKPVIGGTGSGAVVVAYTVALEKGLSQIGYVPDTALKTIYVTQIKADLKTHPEKNMVLGSPHLVPEPELRATDISSAADQDDIGIFTIRRNAGEGADRKVEDFYLSEAEKTQLKAVADAFHAKGKKLIVVLNIGGAIEMESWNKNVDAILLAWQPGLEAGNAIADVLSGGVDPSGKLATTFPVKYEDEPSAKSFPGTPANRPAESIYDEGIYVGYRYFNTFSVKTSYPFGYGLSYTRFAYSNLKLSAATFSKKLTATVTVINSGKVAGKEVVQLYLSAPNKTLDKPSEELKGFGKTRLLQPGASQTLTFTIDPKNLASFNTEKSSWIADAGKYTVKIGASSEDIRMTKPFVLAKMLIVEKDHKAIVPQVSINELKKLTK
ncbi:beta-glucosidase family protein [Mucilaginibacter ginsenosidivorax]|uniref:Beta-glucosidase n=1 Tax=Mucilaginibacter ginsenosidivorax TaxID=862126 RepID=A0A5B8VXS7_9SPHI|nr:glycoside hydrolase family 3 C-terminal domain-containing protein [Mucilaginibacter ginsenosidivorax]QEC75236.1 beta-glucosidase [Mucilaginibacter ginsenosidivorax]